MLWRVCSGAAQRAAGQLLFSLLFLLISFFFFSRLEPRVTSSEVVQKNPSIATADGKYEDEVVILSYLVKRQAATCRDAVAGTEYSTFPS